ncbi:transcriptional regulator [Asanoa ishikariensis]|uniref:DNA-binding transcriptional regulator, ArsR family n=1 Tax=Asanoa ishikariensis TaxID=137265 RepID=A0A1H3NBH4_9ACTN|nr:ArsR family transcriptional regulator [Asanoa ishikariensis]GIF68729.1 transcriptional regulator [Asanoa ishikariensis]SDY86222.1 DNA-binding transcriptional regulator, ArsR family [Asanoa ishikariensis]
MIRIELDAPTLDRTRIAISPLWETVDAFYLLDRNPDGVPWPYQQWAARAREVIRDVPEAARVAWLMRESGSRSPDFLSPIPSTPAPTIEEELHALATTPRSVVEEQLPDYYDDPPAWIRPFRDDPARAFAELAEGLAAFWKGAMAPHWPAMRAALDEEVLHRARALAADGPDALLADLHQRVIWERPVLTLVKPLEQSFSAVDKRLLLIPLIFSRGALMCSTDHPEVVAVSYQARGAAVLAEGRPEPAPDRLAVLIGRGRAAVLEALSRPATTAGLAATLRLAPSTVSEHLTALTAAGVVNRRRAGRRVLYSLEPAGTALLHLLADDPSRRQHSA